MASPLGRVGKGDGLAVPAFDLTPERLAKAAARLVLHNEVCRHDDGGIDLDEREVVLEAILAAAGVVIDNDTRQALVIAARRL